MPLCKGCRELSESTKPSSRMGVGETCDRCGGKRLLEGHQEKYPNMNEDNIDHVLTHVKYIGVGGAILCTIGIVAWMASTHPMMSTYIVTALLLLVISWAFGFMFCNSGDAI